MIVCSGRLGWRAWWRRAAAMLVSPVSRKMVMARLLGHDARAVGGADLGAVFVVGDVAERTQWSRSSISQWTRMIAARSAGRAWIDLVTWRETADGPQDVELIEVK